MATVKIFASKFLVIMEMAKHRFGSFVWTTCSLFNIFIKEFFRLKEALFGLSVMNVNRVVAAVGRSTGLARPSANPSVSLSVHYPLGAPNLNRKESREVKIGVNVFLDQE